MRKLLIPYNLLLLMAMLLSFSSCVKEYDDVVEEEVDVVRLELFTRAYSYNTPVTRAGLADEDKILKDPFIVVFANAGSDYKFVEAVRSFTMNADTKTYVVLKKQEVECKLLILANPQNVFYANINGTMTQKDFDEPGLTEVLNGKTLNEACTMLYTDPLGNPQTDIPFTSNEKTPIPMGLVYTPTISGINESTTIGTPTDNLELKRATAKIIVRNEASNFTLEGITAVMNVSAQGLLYSEAAPLETTDIIEYRKDSDYSEEIAVATVSEGNQSTTDNPIYLYESAAAQDTYFIIKGLYQFEIDENNSELKSCYYKMRIVNSDRQAIDLLRNHQYIFTMTQIDGVGHNTPQEAIDAPAFNNTNIHSTLQVIDPSAYETSAFDDYYLSVSNSIYIAYTDDDVELDAFTLITENIGTETVNGTISIPESYNWITLVSPSSFTATNTLAGQIIKIKTNASGSDREGYINIKLGNLTKSIKIRKKAPLSSAGTVSPNKPIYYYYYNYSSTDPAQRWYGFEYYLLSGYLEDSNNKNWLQLSPGNPELPSTLVNGQNDPLPGVPRIDSEDQVMVDNGQLQVHVLQNDIDGSRSGTIYLSAINNPGYDPPGIVKSFRIKLDITQLAN